jgi:sarcosine oxidase subunit gamma
MSDMTIDALPPVGMIALRGALDDLRGPVEAVTGCALPKMRMSTAAGGTRVLWMSPDELLIVCDHEAAPGLARDLTSALGEAFATVAVIGDARQVFALSGATVEDRLATLMPVDFDRLAPTEVRRTRMAQIPAAIWREEDGWRLMCFRSVAVYAEDLLRNAAKVGA